MRNSKEKERRWREEEKVEVGTLQYCHQTLSDGKLKTIAIS